MGQHLGPEWQFCNFGAKSDNFLILGPQNDITTLVLRVLGI